MQGTGGSGENLGELASAQNQNPYKPRLNYHLSVVSCQLLVVREQGTVGELGAGERSGPTLLNSCSSKPEQGKIRSRGKLAIAHLENWENWEQGKIRARPCSIPVHQNRSRGKFGAGENWEQGGIGSKEELAIALNKKSGYLYTRGLDNTYTRRLDRTYG
jgi:hypothetical protein